MKRQKQAVWLWAASFLIPVALFGCVMLLCRVAPFGDRTLLIWDADGQYSAFLAALRRVLTGQGDALYWLGKGAGSSTAGIVAYYLASPVNALLALFPEGAVVAAFHVIVLVKIGLCGLTFMALLRHQGQGDARGLLFSTTYALMGYAACYFWNVMWMDGVVLLPLIVLGVRRIALRRGGPLPYALALGAALWCSYYIGFMLCVFSVLMFVYFIIDGRMTGERAPLWRTAGTFAGASLLAGGLAAAMLLPAYLALSKGYQVFGTDEVLNQRLFPMAELATKLFTGAYSYQQIRSDLPNIYIGMPMLALLCGYAFNTAIPAGRRALSGALLGVLAISFQLSGLNLFWHGLDLPQAMPARFSFLFCFAAVWLAADSFYALPRAKAGGRMGVVALAFFACVCLLFNGELPTYLAYETLCMDVTFFLTACALIALLALGRKKRAAMAGLCLMQAACLVVNGYFAIRRLDEINQLSAAQSAAYTQQNLALVRRVQAQDGGVYRMERNGTHSENDPLMLGYSGLSHYSSDFDGQFLAFMSRLGLYQSHYRLEYASGTTPVLESVMGVKYILRKDGAALGGLPDGYAQLWREGDVSAWQNPYALSLGFLAPAQEGGGLFEGADPFVNQNALMADLSGIEAPIFTPVEVACHAEGGELHAAFEQRAGVRYYMQAGGSWFAMDAGPAENGDRLAGCVALPVAVQDRQTTLTLFVGEGAQPEDAVRVAAFDESAFLAAWERIAEGNCAVESPTDSLMRIQTPDAAGRSQLVLTLPYDEGWRATADGQPAPIASRYGRFLAVELAPGAHEVELRFVPPGLLAGLGVSAASALALAAWQLLRCRRRRRVQQAK